MFHDILILTHRRSPHIRALLDSNLVLYIHSQTMTTLETAVISLEPSRSTLSNITSWFGRGYGSINVRVYAVWAWSKSVP